MKIFRRHEAAPVRPVTRAAGLPPTHADGPARAQPGGTDGHPYGEAHADDRPVDTLTHLHPGAGPAV